MKSADRHAASGGLHIAIAARAMSQPFGGVREYVTTIVRELMRLGSRHRFSIYYADPALRGSNPEAHEVVLTAPHKLVWDHWTLPRRLVRDRPDIVWFPHNVISLGLRLPSVVSVMDMLYFRLPEVPFREYAWLDTLYMRAFMPRSLRRARRVMAISDCTARDVARITGVPRAQITTIHLAPGNDFRPATDAARAAVRAKYGLTAPYFFYAGVLSPRKNVRTLVEAFGRVQHDLPHDIVLTGGGGYLETPIDDVVRQYGIGGRVRRLGLVPHADLIALYGAADAFVYPSLYEGFGIPPLEAFACGCPVVSSNAAALAEVIGDAALTFDPHDVAALSAALKAVGCDAALRDRLRRAGYARVQEFSYARAADQLLALVEEAASCYSDA